MLVIFANPESAERAVRQRTFGHLSDVSGDGVATNKRHTPVDTAEQQHVR